MRRNIWSLVGIGATLFALDIGRSAPPPASQPAAVRSNEIDYQKTADGTDWSPNTANLLSYWPSDQGKYTVRIEVPPGRVELSILLDGEVKYSWRGHLATVFDISGDRLYWVDYMVSHPGGTVVAVDLTKGAVLWRSKLIGVVAGNHSGYSNKISMEVYRDVVFLQGDEDAGRYVEIKRLSDGKTVGHHIYDDPTTKPVN